MTGLLLTIEGPDGSGKATQTQKIKEYYESLGRTVTVFSFPQYGTITGDVVKDYLQGKFGEATTLNWKLASMTFMLDRVTAIESIKNNLKFGEVVLLDRSPYSNTVFQCSKLPVEERQAAADWLHEMEFTALGFPKPTAVFYLDVPPALNVDILTNRSKESTDAKAGDEDQHENDLAFMTSAYKNGLLLANHRSDWHVIPGMDAWTHKRYTVEQVTEQIISVCETLKLGAPVWKTC